MFYHAGDDACNIIYDMKYHDHPDFCFAIGKLMAKEFGAVGFFDDIDIIMPIPVSYTHLYVLDYIASHKTIAPAAEFEISDSEFEDFKKRVVESNFKYDPISENTFKSLVDVAKFEGYYDDAKEEFKALEKKPVSYTHLQHSSH